jgi:hypothetical protein
VSPTPPFAFNDRHKKSDGGWTAVAITYLITSSARPKGRTPPYVAALLAEAQAIVNPIGNIVAARSMIPKKPVSDLIRGLPRTPGWIPVF